MPLQGRNKDRLLNVFHLKKPPAFGGGFLLRRCPTKKPAPGDRLDFVEDVNRAGETSPNRIT